MSGHTPKEIYADARKIAEFPALKAKNKKLKQQRDDLLAAAKSLLRQNTCTNRANLRAAIARAEGREDKS